MVTHTVRGGASHRVACARERFSQSQWTGATSLLPAERIEEGMRAEGITPYRCLYTPLVTIWTFLAQVLGPDRCCRAAVAKLFAALACLDQSRLSTSSNAPAGQAGVFTGHGVNDAKPDTGPYCKARDRLPVTLLARLARRAAADLHQRYPSGRLLGGRPVKMVDGTTISMPDTAENQARYPQPHTQKPGLGFPMRKPQQRPEWMDEEAY